jgi:hypothetical protein
VTDGEVIVVSNDVVPWMALPVAAPGLRAWGLAAGLRSFGHSAVLAVDATVVERAWSRGVPPARQRDVVVAAPAQIGDLVRTRRPRAVIITNSNLFDALGDLGDTQIIFDFFAPKVLELEQQQRWEGKADALEALTARKLRALKASSAVIINGAKKREYVDRWLARAGCADTPTAVVNLPVTPCPAVSRPANGPLHAVIAGYIQPWSHPGEWAEAIVPFIEGGSLVLHLLVGNHWGRRSAQRALPATFGRLASMPGVRSHGVMEYGDFRRFLAGCHLSIDLFSRNPERELAFVTRTAVSLACGLPAIHVPFTEVSELIRGADAGWLVESTDLDGLTAALTEATTDASAFERKRAGARSVATELDPPRATASLHELLGALS